MSGAPTGAARPGRANVVTVELLPDPDTEARVRADWARLADAGLSSMARHPSPSNRPHLTLLVRGELPVTRFDAALALLPVTLRLSAPVVFRHGDRGVLARGVELTEELRALHRAAHDAVPSGDDAPHTRPGEWTPHVTLARRLRMSDLDRALGLIGQPHDGAGVALRRWDSAAARVTPLG